MKSRTVWAVVLLLVSGLISLPDVATTLAQAAPPPLSNSQAPGSVIVFPKFVRGRFLVDGVQEPASSFQISVTCPAGALCPDGQPVRIRFHWVCPGSVFNICKENDFILPTTVKGTIVFNPERLFASDSTTVAPFPQCPSGYLIGWVIDNFDRPIKFDALLGDAVLRHSSTSVGAYTGIPIQAAASLNTGDLTDVNHDGALQFDGTEYQAVTGKIFSTVRFDHPAGFGGTPTVRETDLTLITLDVRSDRVNSATFADLNFFNAFETLLSEFVSFTCWAEIALSRIDPNLIDILQGSAKGLVQSLDVATDDAGNPRSLLGIVETLESAPPGGGPLVGEYAYELFNDSVPVPTATFRPRPGFP